MSLKKNLITNYVSQIYVTVIGIVMVPLYLKYMGAEAYGLVGFFSMLQAWFNLLDMGLTPTMARETARFRGGAIDSLTFRRLVRALEGIFLLVAIVGCVILMSLSGTIAHRWLKVTALPLDQVTLSVQLMAAAVALRWMSGLYRGQVSGSERLVWLSSYNSLIATLRFGGVLLILKFVSAAPIAFFIYQLILALIELLGLIIMTYRLLPSISDDERLEWSFDTLRPVLKFSMTIAFTSSVWVMVTQTDKLVLSKILPLAEYGYFTFAVLVASGILLASAPVSGAIIPRMTRLEAQGDHAGLIYVYRQATQIVAALAGSACVTIFFFAEQLLWGWTGDKTLATHTAPVLKLYALGNGFLSVSAFPYYLQFAKGNLRLHLIGNAMFILLLIPAIAWFAYNYGAIGAGYVWLGLNGCYFLLWVPLVHSKHEAGLHITWLTCDVLPIISIIGAAGYALFKSGVSSTDRVVEFAIIIGISNILLIVGCIASKAIRQKLITHLSALVRIYGQ